MVVGWRGDMQKLLCPLDIDKVSQRFIKKYDARKQKVYMRSSLQKPKSLSFDAMSSRLKISQGEMTKIVLSMLLVVWVNSMTTAGLKHREKTSLS